MDFHIIIVTWLSSDRFLDYRIRLRMRVCAGVVAAKAEREGLGHLGNVRRATQQRGRKRCRQLRKPQKQDVKRENGK